MYYWRKKVKCLKFVRKIFDHYTIFRFFISEKRLHICARENNFSERCDKDQNKMKSAQQLHCNKRISNFLVVGGTFDKHRECFFWTKVLACRLFKITIVGLKLLFESSNDLVCLAMWKFLKYSRNWSARRFFWTECRLFFIISKDYDGKQLRKSAQFWPDFFPNTPKLAHVAKITIKSTLADVLGPKPLSSSTLVLQSRESSCTKLCE